MKFQLSETEYAEVPEHFKTEYVKQTDGSYHLKIDGEIPEVKAANDRVVEFRNNNIALQKKNDELTENAKRFEGIDPSDYQTLKTKVEEFERSGAKDPADIDVRLNEAVKNAVEPLKAQMAAMQKEKEEANTALLRKDQEGQFAELARKMNVRKSAISDFIARGQRIFNLEGKALDANGNVIFSSKNAALDLTMEEWATELTQEAPHLFEDSKGGGAGGSGSGGGAGSVRTVSTDPLDFGHNLEDVASGKAKVALPS